ncbi:putative quinol monooxygenase [Nonomuraea sp. NPDC050790]|uniref:putative quinol monooxygenase n=1 Tax=Nonomuraea sp. NPDC050790 TaxID=3364371 RepID=UPI0037B1115E
MADSISSIARYRVKPGHEDDFLKVLDDHRTILRDLELVTDREPDVYLGAERDLEGPLVIEIFDWIDEDASARAHTHPLVSGVWESMGPLCESRAGRPPFEFLNLRRLAPR